MVDGGYNDYLTLDYSLVPDSFYGSRESKQIISKQNVLNKVVFMAIKLSCFPFLFLCFCRFMSTAFKKFAERFRPYHNENSPWRQPPADRIFGTSLHFQPRDSARKLVPFRLALYPIANCLFS